MPEPEITSELIRSHGLKIHAGCAQCFENPRAIVVLPVVSIDLFGYVLRVVRHDALRFLGSHSLGIRELLQSCAAGVQTVTD